MLIFVYCIICAIAVVGASLARGFGKKLSSVVALGEGFELEGNTKSFGCRWKEKLHFVIRLLLNRSKVVVFSAVTVSYSFDYAHKRALCIVDICSFIYSLSWFSVCLLRILSVVLAGASSLLSVDAAMGHLVTVCVASFSIRYKD